MIIAGFSCLHEELRKGNLENWLRCMENVCDVIFLLDRGSHDGSREVYADHPMVRVVQTEENIQTDMGRDKHDLLDVLQAESDADWVLWLDGDTMIDGRLLDGGATIREMCGETSADVLSCGMFNLWRSDRYHRVDSMFDFPNRRGVPLLWRNKPGTAFPAASGWHDPSTPRGLAEPWGEGWDRQPFTLLHRGFATDEQIVERIERNRTYGVSENRFLAPATDLREVPADSYPEWFEPADGPHPSDLPPLPLEAV